jgi:hypothetical protein
VEQPPDEQDLPTTPNFATQDPAGFMALLDIYATTMHSWNILQDEVVIAMGRTPAGNLRSARCSWSCAEWCAALRSWSQN